MTTSVKPKRTKHLTPKQVAELQELSNIARQVRGAHYSQEKAESVKRYTALLNKYLKSGVTYAELSSATGIQWRSIKARLQRHGYLNLPPSQRNKNFQGPKESGPKCQHDPKRFRERVNKETNQVTHVECLDCRRNKRISKTNSRLTAQAS